MSKLWLLICYALALQSSAAHSHLYSSRPTASATMMAVAFNTSHYSLNTTDPFGTLSIMKTATGYLVKIRCLEYTHIIRVEILHVSVTSAMLLFKNCRRLSYLDSASFSLLEVLVIARDLENLKRFYNGNFIRSGEGSKGYRNHVWRLAVTQPRIIFKTKLAKADREFVLFLRNAVFAHWSPWSKANFRSKYVDKKKRLVQLMAALFPLEIAEHIVSLTPSWS